jgi:hypothetical protein
VSDVNFDVFESETQLINNPNARLIVSRSGLREVGWFNSTSRANRITQGKFIDAFRRVAPDAAEMAS